MMLDSLKTVCLGTVFSLQCILMSLVWDFKEIKNFFFFKQTVRLPACLTLGGQWGPGQLSVS